MERLIRLIKLPYAFLHYLKLYGLRVTLIRMLRFIANRMERHIPAIQRIHVMASVEDIVRADYIKHPYKRPASRKIDAGLHIAWVLSPLSHGAGGQNTIFRFIRNLEALGHHSTIYLYEGIMPQSLKEARQIMKASFNTSVPIYKIKDFKDKHDVIMATGWETAYPVFNMTTKAHKGYFVQDYEPSFYGVGAKAVLAENTYKLGFFGVTAGGWLTKKLTTQYGMACDYFDFGSDNDIYQLTNNAKRKKVCFYARPVTERRAFELGIIALEVFHAQHPEYEIDFFGWDVSNYQINFPYNNLGILDHEQLAVLYNESAACLVLSLTNSSLLPFELLNAGCIPVTNEGENNRLVLGDNQYVRYVESAPQALADGLSVAVRTHNPKIAQAAAQSVKANSWEASAQKVSTILQRAVSNQL